jgi:hypothetical protein
MPLAIWEQAWGSLKLSIFLLTWLTTERKKKRPGR